MSDVLSLGIGFFGLFFTYVSEFLSDVVCFIICRLRSKKENCNK